MLQLRPYVAKQINKIFFLKKKQQKKKKKEAAEAAAAAVKGEGIPRWSSG